MNNSIFSLWFQWERGGIMRCKLNLRRERLVPLDIFLIFNKSFGFFVRKFIIFRERALFKYVKSASLY